MTLDKISKMKFNTTIFDVYYVSMYRHFTGCEVLPLWFRGELPQCNTPKSVYTPTIREKKIWHTLLASPTPPINVGTLCSAAEDMGRINIDLGGGFKRRQSKCANLFFHGLYRWNTITMNQITFQTRLKESNIVILHITFTIKYLNWNVYSIVHNINPSKCCQFNKQCKKL